MASICMTDIISEEPSAPTGSGLTDLGDSAGPGDATLDSASTVSSKTSWFETPGALGSVIAD